MARGAPTMEGMAPVGRWLVQETCRKALSSKRPRGCPCRSSDLRMESRVPMQTVETEQPFVSLIPSVNS